MAIWDNYYAHYRLIFFLLVWRTVLPPLLVAAVICRIASWTYRPHTVLTYLLTFPAYWTIKIQYDLYERRRDAARKGAILVPEVNGRWIGNIDLIPWLAGIMQTGYVTDELKALFERAGTNVHTINLRILWSDTIFTRDHRVVQYVLATGFPDFNKGGRLRAQIYSMFGNGILSADGAEWKAHRALIRPFFARERITNYGHFDTCSNKVIQLFKDRADAGESIDVQDVFARFTIDMAGEFFFGAPDWNTLDTQLPLPGKAAMNPEGRYNDFVEATDKIQDAVLQRRPWGDMWPLREMFRDVSAEANHTIDKWVEPLIHRAMNAKAKHGNDEKELEEGSFLDHMVHSTNDVRLIRDELVNILFAARDSTTALLTFLFYLLSLHPEVLSKLRSEILAVVPIGPPSHEDVRKLRYLRACFDETLRLFAPIPASGRQSARSCVLPVSGVDAQGNEGPIYMPGDVMLIYSALLTQRRKDLWGEDAEEFVPERWMDPDRMKDLAADPLRFFPFNAGPRICPGQNYAYNEASYLVIRILQAFDTFELCQEDAPQGSQPPAEWKSKGGRHAVEKIWPMAALTMHSKGGVWLRMKLAQT